MHPVHVLRPPLGSIAALLLLAACGDPSPVIGRQVHVDFEPPGRLRAPVDAPPPPLLARTPAVIAFTSDGDLAVVDGSTGARLATAATATGAERDVSFDPWHGRVFVLALDGEGAGELVAHGAALADGSPVLGPAEHVCWIDGPARVLATPQGPVLFERGYGERWRLIRDDGEPSASAPAPVPRSAWLTVHAHGSMVQALAPVAGDDDAPARARAPVWATGIGAHAFQPLGPVGLVGAPGRLAAAPALDGELFVAPSAGSLEVYRLPNLGDGTLGQADPPSIVPIETSGALEQLAVADRGRTLVALLASADDGGGAVLDGATALVADLDESGRVARQALVALPGPLLAGRGDIERHLAVLRADRVLVGASTRVVALGVARRRVDGEIRLEVGIDGGFAGAGLTSPLEVWTGSAP